MVSTRQYKIASEITRVLAQTCLLKVSDERLKQIRVKETRMSKDFSQAIVYVGVAGCEDQSDALSHMKALKKAVPFLRKVISTELSLRIVPRLDFRYDVVEKHAQDIDKLLDTLR